jgi:hypothetical protein
MDIYFVLLFICLYYVISLLFVMEGNANAYGIKHG